MKKSIYASAELVLLIERELRLLALWEDHPPESETLASAQPFSSDKLSFHQWLQWKFIPAVKFCLEHGHVLPAGSSISNYAEMEKEKYSQDVSNLLALIKQYDETVNN